MNPESALENLRRLLLGQRWIEGTRTLAPSSLLSLFYGDQSSLKELPALSAAMEICARAHPTMRAEELARLDDALSEVLGEAQSELDRWLEAWLDSKVEKVTEPDERFARSSAFVEQLLGVPDAPRIRLSLQDIERMNQVDRAFTKLFRLPTLKLLGGAGAAWLVASPSRSLRR
ncbi:hypothetical protein [Archangium violaceum]|uniref:Uncharacterized protein n=1 Tax=Archangium violaceum Cb vi76 TaxID=1406225 RepID=A0A084SPM1_9BACT|nr:hypothetical protein [Archangium violaceum]KFA90406.1 hypothetical protein Q664_28595 [Archangium violaceum Cb vi76]